MKTPGAGHAPIVIAFLALATALSAEALTIAEKGVAKCVVVVSGTASAPERNAVKDLTNTLCQVTGATFEVVDRAPRWLEAAIYVGCSGRAQQRFGSIVTNLADEEIVIETKGRTLLLAGGGTRGTLYAVSRFLQDQCGVRWWTPWSSRIPKLETLKIGSLHLREKPAFEYREPYWTPAFNAQWAVRNFANGQSAHIPNELGGCIRYKGFVHTFYPLVAATNFTAHPEWFSLIKGQRTTKYSQLCLTNPQLRDQVVQRVKQWLRESPEARIVSVSQNDWQGWCECDQCRAIDDREGTHAGTMIAFVNYVAEKIEPEFPHVAVDTLAYQYTRKPPKTLKPRPNVIVRLCSIECNFREPFEHPSNASFAADIRGWAAVCNRLYIWDYSTDFAHYVQPHPNWYVLGPDLQFFAQHHVKGVFSEGAYQSHGSELAELRAWVTAQLMWNPARNDRALIRDFVEGYYGTNAAPDVLQYLDLMHEASKGHNLTCYSRTDAPFLKFTPLSQAERLWQHAEQSTTDPELLARLRIGHLPVRYVFLQRWAALQKECTEVKSEWPVAATRKSVADEFAQVAKGVPGQPWAKVTQLNEGGLTLDGFLNRFKE